MTAQTIGLRPRLVEGGAPGPAASARLDDGFLPLDLRGPRWRSGRRRRLD